MQNLRTIRFQPQPVTHQVAQVFATCDDCTTLNILYDILYPLVQVDTCREAVIARELVVARE